MKAFYEIFYNSFLLV